MVCENPVYGSVGVCKFRGSEAVNRRVGRVTKMKTVSEPCWVCSSTFVGSWRVGSVERPTASLGMGIGGSAAVPGTGLLTVTGRVDVLPRWLSMDIASWSWCKSRRYRNCSGVEGDRRSRIERRVVVRVEPLHVLPLLPPQNLSNPRGTCRRPL